MRNRASAKRILSTHSLWLVVGESSNHLGNQSTGSISTTTTSIRALRPAARSEGGRGHCRLQQAVAGTVS